MGDAESTRAASPALIEIGRDGDSTGTPLHDGLLVPGLAGLAYSDAARVAAAALA
jgi:hypothetical protein